MGRRRVKRAGTRPSDLADTVLRLAVLLQAGAAPSAALRHLADSGDEAAARITAGGEHDIVAALADDGPDPAVRGEAAEQERAAWRDLAASWEIATTVGAPLAESLRTMASALRDAQELQDDVRVALAEPRATGRLMAWLPAFGILIGIALGFDTFRVITTTPFGIGFAVAGLSLMLVARLWTSRLLRAAGPPPGVPGTAAELTAIALAGGVAIDRATQLVDDAPGGPRPSGERDSVLALSQAAGVPAVELLRASAGYERHRARVNGRLRAARLSTRLLLPLGVCTLPAFLCLGISPLMLSIITEVPLPL